MAERLTHASLRRRLCTAAILTCTSAAAAGQTGRFDLLGPSVSVHVSRGDQSLPIASVPNLQAGDKLQIQAELPQTQSVHLLLVVAFLRGATNPPPDSWFTRVETWKAKPHNEGITVTVPDEAEQALIFIAPETGGDFSTLKSAVRGRPGTFVRASQDLNEASFEQSRIERYVQAIKQVPADSPAALLDHSHKLAATLQLKPDEECFKKSPELQATCLRQTGSALLLDDGHGQTMAQLLTTGATSDLIGAVAVTPVATAGSIGAYSAYVGTVLDVVRLLTGLHTAKYQYIPAIAFPDGDSLNLRLNTAPSFHNPKSVIVIALPAIQKAVPPPLQLQDARHVACLVQPHLVLPLSGAPLVFATGFAHDLTLHLNEPAPDGQTDLPLVPDAFEGGLVVSDASPRKALAAVAPQARGTEPDGPAKPDSAAKPEEEARPEDAARAEQPTGEPPQGAQPAGQNSPKPQPAGPKPAGEQPNSGSPTGPTTAGVRPGAALPLGAQQHAAEQPERHAAADGGPEGAALQAKRPSSGSGTIRSTGVVRGFWGFDRFEGPTLPLQREPGKSWTVATQGDVFAGRSSTVSIASTGLACVSSVSLVDGQGTRPLEWHRDEKDPHTLLTVKLPLEKAAPGGLSLAVAQYGTRAIQSLPLTAYADAVRVDEAVAHAADTFLTLRGSGLAGVRSATVHGNAFAADKLTGDDHALRMTAAAGTDGHDAAKDGFKPGEHATVEVALLDGRTLRVPLRVDAARPAVSLLHVLFEPKPEGNLPVTLGNPASFALDGKLTLVLRSESPAKFGRTEKVEVAAEDGSASVLLSLQDRTLVLQDARTALGFLVPLTVFGPSGFGPVQLRAIAADGTTSDWMPVGSLTRTPMLRSFSCAARGAGVTKGAPVTDGVLAAAPVPPVTTSAPEPCVLAGSDLFLIDAVGASPAFAQVATVPVGYAQETLGVPRPADGHTLYLRLRDDPEHPASVAVEPAKPTHQP